MTRPGSNTSSQGGKSRDPEICSNRGRETRAKRGRGETFHPQSLITTSVHDVTWTIKLCTRTFKKTFSHPMISFYISNDGESEVEYFVCLVAGDQKSHLPDWSDHCLLLLAPSSRDCTFRQKQKKAHPVSSFPWHFVPKFSSYLNLLPSKIHNPRRVCISKADHCSSSELASNDSIIMWYGTRKQVVPDADPRRILLIILSRVLCLHRWDNITHARISLWPFPRLWATADFASDKKEEAGF